MQNSDSEHSDLSHIYWMGGSPCGGKSTVSKIIAEQYGLQLYSIDEEMHHLMQDISAKAQPALTYWLTQSWDERWFQPADELLKFIIQAYDEEFTLCIEEIKAIPPSQPTLVEGNPLRPELVLPLLVEKHHAIWLIAGDRDMRHYYSQREWARHIVEETCDPEKAFDNWMNREIAFANMIRKSCEDHQMTFLLSDRQLPLEVKARKVADNFRLPCDL